jgi:Family of unknown function (DUF6527)
MRLARIIPRFVEFVPEELEEGILYISEVHGTAIHKCCCGCGEEVVTPLTPADWHLRKQGHIVSLTPSIGNWNYACQSHYWIRKNRVEWAPRMSEEQIRRVQARDRLEKERYIAYRNAQRAHATRRTPWTSRLWATIRSWWR